MDASAAAEGVPTSDDARRYEVLTTDRAQVAAQIQALARDFAGMVAASESSNADDEHDPEGATIAFERAQLEALLRHAQARLDDLDRALDLLRAGAYGVCTGCGAPIGAERLDARPAARTCIRCAGRATRRPPP